MVGTRWGERVLAKRVERFGKQVKVDGEHLADCVDEETAQVVVSALTYIGLPKERIPVQVNDLLRGFFK